MFSVCLIEVEYIPISFDILYPSRSKQSSIIFRFIKLSYSFNGTDIFNKYLDVLLFLWLIFILLRFCNYDEMWHMWGQLYPRKVGIFTNRCFIALAMVNSIALVCFSILLNSWKLIIWGNVFSYFPDISENVFIFIFMLNS